VTSIFFKKSPYGLDVQRGDIQRGELSSVPQALHRRTDHMESPKKSPASAT
jgi:hypothetical protein